MDKVVYEELRREARRILGRHAPGHSVTPSILVHDAYMRLAAAGKTPAFASQLHFRAAASLAMRHVLVDRARRRNSHKRGRGWSRVVLFNSSDALVAGASADPSRVGAPVDVDLLALADALEALVVIDPEGATIVQMRFFGELTNEEIAQTMGLALRSVERSWRAARAWLLDRLRDP
jgi:RNA polymerase sigma factor (TIGR02999 family)